VRKAVLGEVMWFDQARGYGYICVDGDKQIVLFHVSAIHQAGMKTVTEGQRFQFKIGQHEGRRVAVDLALETRPGEA
jgi:CspA family cold shock protein